MLGNRTEPQAPSRLRAFGLTLACMALTGVVIALHGQKCQPSVAHKELHARGRAVEGYWGKGRWVTHIRLLRLCQSGVRLLPVSDNVR